MINISVFIDSRILYLSDISDIYTLTAGVWRCVYAYDNDDDDDDDDNDNKKGFAYKGSLT